MNKRKDTTIPILKTTKKQLRKKKLVPGETWDSIINRLMKVVK